MKSVNEKDKVIFVHFDKDSGRKDNDLAIGDSIRLGIRRRQGPTAWGQPSHLVQAALSTSHL